MKTYHFTKLDTFNLTKWDFVNSCDSLKSAVESLHHVNSIENHMLICQQIIGYVRCLHDIGWIEKIYI